nr:LLM class flavin-dependent oxidoreductase [Salsipaludibacter albus]
MIEGQESVTWDQWRALATATEEAGLEGLFRSDHYQSVMGVDQRSSLDAWATLAALGPLTDGIRLGTMVSPTSFRHPSVLAKLAVTADHTSGGRVELGLGAGWHEIEHVTHGFPFHDVGTRFDVFEEQLEIIARQLGGESFAFSGEHYELHDSRPLPGPVQERLPIIIGGSAKPRTVRNAVAWADEYNTVAPTLEQVRERRAAITAASEEAGRDPLPLSVMTGCLLGEDESEVADRAARLLERDGGGDDVEAWLQERRATWVVGTVEQAAERLVDLEEAGVSRVMLQNLLHDDLDMVALMGRLG